MIMLRVSGVLDVYLTLEFFSTLGPGKKEEKMQHLMMKGDWFKEFGLIVPTSNFTQEQNKLLKQKITDRVEDITFDVRRKLSQKKKGLLLVILLGASLVLKEKQTDADLLGVFSPAANTERYLAQEKIALTARLNIKEIHEQMIEEVLEETDSIDSNRDTWLKGFADGNLLELMKATSALKACSFLPLYSSFNDRNSCRVAAVKKSSLQSEKVQMAT